MLSTLHNNTLTKRRGGDQGFTLIELLVVIVIIGILAAIAIPAFLNQRQTARDASVTSDVRNAATEVQTAMANYPDATYFAVAEGTPTTNASAVTWSFVKGDTNGKVTFFIGNSDTDYTAVTANLSTGGRIYIRGVPIATGSTTMKPGEYVIAAYNISGSPSNSQVWDSSEGGLRD